MHNPPRTYKADRNFKEERESMKKIISAIITLAMIASMFTALPVYADPAGDTGGEGGDTYTAPDSPAVTYNMNVDWKFKKASGTVYPLAKAQESVAQGDKQFYDIDYDDAEWETVSVPHPINAEDTFDGAAMDSGEQNYYRGFMFYRKHVTIPETDAGKKMFLEFEAVRQSVYLWVNGQMVGYYEAGIAPIGFDITKYVTAGDDNVIAVATDNSASRGNNNDTRETKPGSTPGAADGNGYQWNTADFNEVQGGITGNVNLYAKGKVYQTLPLYNNLKTTGNYIYGSNYDIDAKSATINVKSEIRNETAADADLTLQVDVVGMDGKLAYSGTQTGKAVKATDADAHFMNMVPEDAYLGTTEETSGETPEPTDISTVDVSYITASFKAENMRFWSDKDPYLYTVYTILKDSDGNAIDVQKTVTGFRKVDYNIDEGLLINDKSTYLKGYAQRSTNEWAVIGTANDWLTDMDMRLLKESNGNHIRWMHVAPKPVEVRSTDKYGILVTCPAGDKEGDTDGRSWDQRVEAMRDVMIYFRNNPSVLFWEAGNNAITPAHMQEMTDLKAELDPDGGRFAGSRTISSVDQIKAAEYVGTMLNRNASTAKTSMASADGKYMPIMETEYARDEAPRRVWDDFSPPDYDYKNRWLNGADKEDGYDMWDETSEDFARINASAYNEFWAGRVGGGGSELYAGAAIMVWSDSNMHNRNTYSENCRTSGKVDPVRQKKEAFYALQAVQSDEPAVHIIGHWSYPEYIKDDREKGNYWYEDRTLKDGTPVHWEPNGNFLQRDPTKKDVYVIGSPDIIKVELYIDDALVKTDLNPDDNFVYKFTEIDVTKGNKVSVKAYDESDTVVAEDDIVRTGKPAEVKLTPVTGPDGLIADGSDVMYFDVEVLDEDGNVCPLDYSRLDLELNGNGVLLGGYTSGVGDLNTTHKDYTYAECGTNRIFVRSTRDAGKITLAVTHATLGTVEASIDSVAFDNSVGASTGLSTTMQRAYKANEQPPVIEQNVEAFKPLAAPLKADFSEDGNTEVVEEVDTNVYYTVKVNGEDLNLTDELRARDGSASNGVFGPVTPVLEKLKTLGAISDYTVGGSPLAMTFTAGEHTYKVTADTNAIYKDEETNGTEIIENAMEIGGDLFVNYSAVFGRSYIPGVTFTKDAEAKTCAINYTPVSPASVDGDFSLTSVQGEMTYDHKTVTITVPEAVTGACLIFAAYDDNGRLVKVTPQNVDLEANTAKYVTVPEEILSSGTTQKAMLWDSLKGMTPICEPQPIVPVQVMDPAECEEQVLNLTYDDETDGVLTVSDTKVSNAFGKDMGATLQKESRISFDFRFDEATGSIRFTNKNNKTGPNMSFNGTSFRTQTGGGDNDYQDLGAIELNKWYRFVIEGTMATTNPSAVGRLYSLESGEPVLIKETPGMNLRNYGSTNNGVADWLEVNPGISIDNLTVTSLYANTVDVSAVKTDIKANESVMLSAIAKRNGNTVTIPEFEWSILDMEGNPLNDDTIKIENNMLFTTADTQTQSIVVRATAQTKGNPYGEVRINITAIDTSHDTFNSIELASEKEYVRLNEPAQITVSAKMNDTAVTPANDDIVWTVLNEAGIRETGNTGITVTNGKVEVTEDVIPQKITVRAANISGSAYGDIKLTVKPGTMILDGEEGNKDEFVSGDACEEIVTGRELKEGSWDGSGYYSITAATDFVGFPSDNGNNVLYSADMKFGGNGAGWTVYNNDKGKQGLQVKYADGKLAIQQDSSKAPTYCNVDTESWYNVQIMCATGVDNAYANLIVYKYVNGERVNPETGEAGKPYVSEGVPMRNLGASQANHIAINPNTCVDNVYCAKIVPDALTASVDKDTMFAGQSIQGTATALRKGVKFGNTLAGLIRWVVYNADNTDPLGSDLIKVDASGKMTVDAMAEPQTVYLRAQTLDGSLHDEVKITIQSGDIFTINKIGFNDDYSKVTQLKVTKNFAYSDTVTFIVAVYDNTETTLKSVTTRKMSAKSIAREEMSAIAMDAPMPDGFDKTSDVLYVYAITSNSENEAVTEADGTITAAFSSDALAFTAKPTFDTSKPVIVMVVKPGTVTTSVRDEDVVYIKQINGVDLANLTSIDIPNAASGDYIIKMAGKIDGISAIKTGKVTK